MDTYTKGHDGNQWLSGFINTSSYLREGRSFVYSSYPGYTVSNYSMPFLFLRYLNTQANRGYSWQGDFYSKFYQASGLGSMYYTPWRRYDANRVEYVMRQYSPTADWDFKQALINFYIAIQVQANEGIYGFYGDPVISRKISGFPIYGGASGSSVDIEKCGAIMVKTINGSFTVPSDAGKDVVFVAFSPGSYEKGLSTAGTEDDPHLIANAEDLSYIWDAGYNDDHFRLVSSFEADAAYYDFWLDNFYNENMTASQKHYPDFYGALDGNGYSISKLSHPLCKSNHGLIRDIRLDCELVFSSQLFGAVSCGNYGSIEDCSVHGSIIIPDDISSYYNDQYAWIGGVCGDMRNNTGAYPSRITRCESDIRISGELDVYKYFYIGGIAGSSSVSSGEFDISDCYSSASLELSIKDKLPGAVVLGGITGEASGALSKNCYSVAAIDFTNNNGGDLTGKLYTGRALGRASYSSVYQNIYSLDGFASCGGHYIPEGVISASEAQMRQQGTYQGFDFTSVWQMPLSGTSYPYPTLRSGSAPLVSMLIGDVTQDGVVSVADAVIVCRHIARLSHLNGRVAALGDVNGDSSIDVSDLLLICRYVAGNISGFPLSAKLT